MSKYQARIRPAEGDEVYAVIVRVDSDGQECVLRSYKGRFFKSRAAAERSTQKYIDALCKEIGK